MKEAPNECSERVEVREKDTGDRKNSELLAAAFLPRSSSASILTQYWQSFHPSVATVAAAVGVTSGCIAFGSTLALSTCLQKHVLRISTGTVPRLIPSSVGFLSVSIASWISHKAAVAGQGLCVQCYTHNRDIFGGSVSPALSSAFGDLRKSVPQLVDHAYDSMSGWRDGSFPVQYWERDAFSSSSHRHARKRNNQDRITLPSIFGNDDPITLPITMHQVKM